MKKGSDLGFAISEILLIISFPDGHHFSCVILSDPWGIFLQQSTLPKGYFFSLLIESDSQFWEQFNSPLTVVNLQENSCGKQTNKQAHNLMQHQFGIPNKVIKNSTTVYNSKHRWFGRKGNQANIRDMLFSERPNIISFIY